MSVGWNRAVQRPARSAARFTRGVSARQPREGPVFRRNRLFRTQGVRTVCLLPGGAYLECMTVHFPFQNTYAALPANFFARVAPTPVAAPRLIKLNRALAVHLGLDPDVLGSPEGAEILAGKRVPDGADPIAMAYAGHQFGHFVPQLGDGRAILLGEVIDADGVRR